MLSLDGHLCIVFLKPKLNPEYEDMMLFGPGVKAVAIPNKISGKNWSYTRLSQDHFQFFEKDESKQLYRLFQ